MKHVGALLLGLIFLAVIVTIPSRWKIQKDLENIRTSLKETTLDIKTLCDNQCNPPYPESLEKFLASGGPLSEEEKETCNQNCTDIKEMQKSWGLEFIYRKYPYMGKDNKYYFYSSMINCLFGLGGCPPAFLREELGL